MIIRKFSQNQPGQKVVLLDLVQDDDDCVRVCNVDADGAVQSTIFQFNTDGVVEAWSGIDPDCGLVLDRDQRVKVVKN